MITVHSACPIVIEHPENGSLAFSAGVWQFDRLTTLRGTTNQIINVETYPDGTVVVVDLNGWQSVSPGVDLRGPALSGFILALLTVGLVLGLKYVIRFVSRSFGGGGPE